MLNYKQIWHRIKPIRWLIRFNLTRETSCDPLPWRGKSKPSQQQWNVSPNKIKTLKNSYSRRMLLWVPKRKTKKVPALKEGIKRGQKVAMPQVDQNDRT